MSSCFRFLSLLCLFFVVGCSPAVELSMQDVSDKAWLLRSSSQVEPEGFFLHPRGLVLMLTEGRGGKTQWYIDNKALHLEEKDTMKPVMINESLCLESTSTGNSLHFCPVELSSLEPEKKYFPTFMKQDSENDKNAFVQFDVSEGVIRGFGGVNNFRGKFSREDIRSVDFGPIMSTRMAGPGMDNEFRLIQCLDRSDGMLVVLDYLYLYQGTTLLCSFRSEPKRDNR